MALTDCGEMSIGVAVPAGAQAAALAVANLEAQLAALATFTATVDFGSLSADLLVAGQIVAAIQAEITLGLIPPSVQLQFDLVAAMALAVQASLDIVLGIVDLFATAGVHVYAWDGQADQFGAAITAEFSGDTNHSNAVVLFTEIGAAWTAMQSVFKTTP